MMGVIELIEKIMRMAICGFSGLGLGSGVGVGEDDIWANLL